MDLGQYYQCFVNYHAEPKELEPLVPKGFELDLFEGRPVASWVASSIQQVKILGITWPSQTVVYHLSLRTYVRKREGNQWHRGFLELASYLSSPRMAQLFNCFGLGMNQRFSIERSVHFEPHEKSSRGVFQYQWKNNENKEWEVLKLRTLGLPEPAMVGYLEYFTAEKQLQFFSSEEAKRSILHEHEPWYLWEIDDLVLPKAWPGTYLLDLNERKPLSGFVVKGSKVSLKRIKI